VRLLRFVVVGLACLALSGCAGFSNVTLKPFGLGASSLSSAQKCTGQGYREGSTIFGECVSFYDKQTATNRRNIALAIGVAAVSVIAFEGQCDCLFGPDRGDKFSR
jgi:hypothetical protein